MAIPFNRHPTTVMPVGNEILPVRQRKCVSPVTEYVDATLVRETR
jgi:hypothetical protein